VPGIDIKVIDSLSLFIVNEDDPKIVSEPLVEILMLLSEARPE
jgi:hypothetical protein